MAGTKYITIARKLQTACNKVFGIKLLIDQKQWYNIDKKRATTIYIVYKVTGTDTKGGKKRDIKIELFRTYSQIQLVLFLRDFWYELNNWEVPKDNPKWEEIKAQYEQRHEPNDKEPTIRDTEQSNVGEPGGSTLDCYRTTVCN